MAGKSSIKMFFWGLAYFSLTTLATPESNYIIEELSTPEIVEVQKREGLDTCQIRHPLVSMYNDQAGKSFLVHFSVENRTESDIIAYLILIAGNHDIRLARAWPHLVIQNPNYNLITPIYSIPEQVSTNFKQGASLFIRSKKKVLVGAWIPWPTEVVRAFTQLDVYLFNEEGRNLLSKKFDLDWSQ